jgi:hypothetical protein
LEETPMLSPKHTIIVALIVAVSFGALAETARAQTQPAAFTGQVSSAAEPVMEGVVVSAKREG